LDAGKKLAGLLEKSSGYTVVPVVPPSEADLVNGFGNGNAHIGVLSPYAYLLASNQGTVEAAFARQHGNEIFYGAQYIAHTGAGFKTYFDPLKNGNLAEAATALAQFRGKKPCWADERSPSGYVVPLGFLNQEHIQTRDPAFLAGHVAVVRAIDVSGICDFGATYIDARSYPGLEDQYPNLLKKVDVIWRIPPIIPYETLVFVHGMDESMRRALTRAFVDLESTADGKSAMQILYGFDSMQVVQDSQYDAFRKAVKASGLDLNALIK
jgi:phosphonate transport system substrate-binding protein